jgi:uncharacterized protein (TIGR02594 family)
MSGLPALYAWLAREHGPRMLVEALALYGTRESPGAANNPAIMAWAAECGIKGYTADSIPWCGLGMAVAAKRAVWDHAPGGNPLWALNWAKWGAPADVPSLGDVLVFVRPSGGHVGLYVGEDTRAYHVLGANQGDAVSIVRIAKSRLRAARRAPWKVMQPGNVRPVQLAANGKVSQNEG